MNTRWRQTQVDDWGFNIYKNKEHHTLFKKGGRLTFYRFTFKKKKSPPTNPRFYILQFEKNKTKKVHIKAASYKRLWLIKIYKRSDGLIHQWAGLE